MTRAEHRNTTTSHTNRRAQRRGFGTGISVLLFAGASVICGCVAEPSERAEATEDEPEGVGDGTSLLSQIDCAESTKTGYSKGTPFEIRVVQVDGKSVERDTANAYYRMAQAAASDGVNLAVVSGFRSMQEQEYLYACYVNCNCNDCNEAATPGNSNHQSGHALDLNTAAPGVYDWLASHAGAYGFARTVPSESWHWEWWGAPEGGPCGPSGAGKTADVYVLQRHGGSEKTEVHVLSGADDLQSFSAQVATALHPTDEGPYELGVGDFDGDGHHDVYLITRRGGSGTTEVHVLDAADGFQSFLVNSASALHPTDDGSYDFGIGDFDGDGRDDLYVINRRGAEEKTEVHVLAAADDFHRFSLHSATALHRTDEGAYDFVVGDFNGDGRDDLYFINRSGADEKTEVHVLDAADDFHGFSLHSATALHRTDAGPYEFGAGDYDGDGRDDVYVINRVGGSGTTDVHVLDAASDFQVFSLHAATALHPSDSELYEFGIGAL